MTATLNQDLPQAIDDFFAKDIPEPFQVLGLKLLPLSIGRYRSMARHGVAFVSEIASKPTGADLILGVAICYMPRKRPKEDRDESNLYWDEVSTSEKLPQLVKGWLKQIHAVPPWYLRGQLGAFISATWIGKRWRKRNSFDLLATMQLFNRYISDAQKVPKFLRRHGGADGMSVSHWSQNLETVLLSDLNWDLEDIEEQPLSKAITMFYKHMENQGLITILTEQDYQDIKKTDERVAIALAEFKAKGGTL